MPQVAHGYPDFNRVVSQSDVLFAYETGTAYAGNTVRALGFVGYLPFLGVKFRSNGGAQRLRMSFYADAALTQVLGQYVVDVGAAGFFASSVPVQGPYCALLIINGIGVGNFDLAVWSCPAEFVGNDNAADDFVLLSTIGGAIGAGVTVTLNATRVYPGEAWWTVNTTAATWTADLNGVLFDTTVIYLQRTDNNFPRDREWVMLPAMQHQVVIHNTSGAGGSYNVALVARPWSPGR